MRPLAALIALVGTANALADGAQPYTLGINETLSHDSNIFRNSAVGGGGSTNTSSTSLVGSVDQPLGRQAVHADAFISENRYLNRSELNNTSYGLDALLRWSTVARISGTVGAAVTRGLADYAATTLVAQRPVFGRNIATSQTYYASVDKGMAARWSIDASVAHRSLRYSALQFATATFDENSGTVGLNYHPSNLLSIGPSISYARGEYPDYVLTNGEKGDTYTRRDYSLNATYALGGLTGLNARIGYTQESNSIAPQQDFSGFSGALGFNYSQGGKTSFFGSITRDTGSNFYPINTGLVASLPSVTQIGPPSIGTAALNSVSFNNSQVTVAESLNMAYAATARVSLGIGVSHSNHTLRDPRGGTGADSGNSVFASARYTPKRYLSLGCGASYSNRNSSSALSTTYSDRYLSCSAQFTLR